MLRALFRVLCLLLGAITFPSVAHAQRVLVVRPSTDDKILFEAYSRLNAELTLQSFEVDALEPREADVTLEELDSEAQRRDAFAALALRRSRNGTTVDICIVDRVTGKTTLRRLLIEGTSDGPTLIAVRAVDLLKLSLQELSENEKPPRDVANVTQEPPPRAVAAFTREPSRFQLRAGALLLESAALGPSIGATFGLGYRFASRWSLSLEGTGPLYGASFRTSQGQANVRQEFGLVLLSTNLLRPTRGEHIECTPRIGAGVHHLAASGMVSPPLVGNDAESLSFAGTFGLDTQYFFGEQFSISGEVGGLVLSPQPVLAVGEFRSSPLTLQVIAALRLNLVL